MRIDYIKSWGDQWRIRYVNNDSQLHYTYLPKAKFRDELDVYKWWHNHMKEQTNEHGNPNV